MKAGKIILFKKLTAVMISAVMLFVCVSTDAAADAYFIGYVTADDPGISVNGISIDIYGSKLRYSANGLKRYEHYYSTTVKTDSRGRFTFLRPTTKTLLKVDLSTLPYGTGMNARTRLVSSRYDDTFRLSYITDISISDASGGMVFGAEPRAADGSVLYADCKLTDTVKPNTSVITYDKLNSVRLYRTVTASAAGIRRSRTFEIDISDCSVTGKLSRLLEYGVITENIKQDLTAEYKEDTATPEDLRPVFDHERTFSARNFMLHSERGTANIESYERSLKEVVDVFFGKYDFLEPYHEFVSGSSSAREQYLHIYVVDPDSIKVKSAVSPKNIVGKTMQIDKNDQSKGCYIVLAPDSDLLRFKWTLAHEIFHGIVFRYTEKDQAVWFKEAFADYGSILCINGSIPALTKHMTNYLNSVQYPLYNGSSYKNRSYGIFLLPLYIHNNLGGVNTIKNVLKAYRGTNSAYLAIDRGLRATNSSYSFADLYAGFKDMNAFTDFYKLRDLSSGKTTALVREKAVRTMGYSLGKSDNTRTPEVTLISNSAAYFEFSAHASSKGRLTVTVETDGNASDSSFNLILKGKNIIIPARKKTSSLMTFVLSDLGGSCTSAVLTAGNTSMSADKQIRFGADVYFEES